MTKIYQMYDKLAEQAGPVFEAVNDAVALRGTQKHREQNPDLELYCVAERSLTETGIKAFNVPSLIWKLEMARKVVEDEN